jgi:hypothetical protein
MLSEIPGEAHALGETQYPAAGVSEAARHSGGEEADARKPFRGRNRVRGSWHEQVDTDTRACRGMGHGGQRVETPDSVLRCLFIASKSKQGASITTKSKRGAPPAVPPITKSGAQTKELVALGVQVGPPPRSPAAAPEGTPGQSPCEMKQLGGGSSYVCVPGHSSDV